jgi:hypothetical protein
MEKTQLVELIGKTDEAMKDLELQFNAQMNWLVGRQATLSELLRGDGVSPEQALEITELLSYAENAVKDIELQYRAQMNYLAGRKAILVELAEPDPEPEPLGEGIFHSDEDGTGEVNGWVLADPDSVAKGN